MATPEDETLTVEQAAKVLKVNPATVLRELRAQRLPGNTVGRAWRIRRADLWEYLKGTPPVRVTEGELAFEMYLSSIGVPFGFEEAVPGTTKRPDYRLTVAGQICRFEVKQFDPQPDDFREGVGTFDPYPPLREKIEAARKKFKGLKGSAPCSLVLYNNGKPLVFLTPLPVYAAMLGNLGLTFPVNTRMGVGEHDRAQQGFMGGGKMIRYGKGGKNPVAAQNTTISAIIAISAVNLSRRRTGIEIRRRERAAGRDLSFEERWAAGLEWAEAHAAEEPGVLRVRVYENPFAVKELPPRFGHGPWDERFGPEDGRLVRKYVGPGLKSLEEEEKAAGIEVDPWKW